MKSNPGLLQMADEVLKDYGLKIDCYNLETRAALRCEILFAIVSGLGVEKTALNLISGLKSGWLVKLEKTESLVSAERSKNKFENLPDLEKLNVPSIGAKLKPVDSHFKNPNSNHFVSDHADLSVAKLDNDLVILKATHQGSEEAQKYTLLKELGIANHYRGVTRTSEGHMAIVSDLVEGPLIKCNLKCGVHGSLKDIPVGSHTWKEFDRIGRTLDENGIISTDLQFIISKKTGLPVLIDPEEFNFLGKQIKSLSLDDAKRKFKPQMEELSLSQDVAELFYSGASSKTRTDYYSKIIQRSMGD